jgi:ElaB/YqjD/DUF883 family membrane-anchored ribosome-binding protein
MNDSDLTPKTNISRNQKTTGSSQNIKEQVTGAGAELKQRAAEALRATSDTAQDLYQGATETAKDLTSEAKDKLEDQARQQQQTGAEYVTKFAGNIREAARAFEKDVPFAAHGINSVAEYVEEAAEKIRQGSFRDLVDNATDFAKHRPAAFLGISVLAGFAAVRFLKASGQSSSSLSGSGKRTASPSGGGNWNRTTTPGGQTSASSRPGSPSERDFGSNSGQASFSQSSNRGSS